MHHTRCKFATELLSFDILRIFAYGYCHILLLSRHDRSLHRALILCIILVANLQLSYCHSTFYAFFAYGYCHALLLSRHDRYSLTTILCTGAPYTLQICNWIIAIKHFCLQVCFCAAVAYQLLDCILGHFHSAILG